MEHAPTYLAGWGWAFTAARPLEANLDSPRPPPATADVAGRFSADYGLYSLTLIVYVSLIIRLASGQSIAQGKSIDTLCATHPIAGSGRPRPALSQPAGPCTQLFPAMKRFLSSGNSGDEPITLDGAGSAASSAPSDAVLTQKIDGVSYTPQKAIEHLKERKCCKPPSTLVPQLDTKGQAVLWCTACSKSYSISNPTLASQHACKPPLATRGGSAGPGPSSEAAAPAGVAPSGGHKRSKKRGPMEKHVLTEQQQEAAVREAVMFILTSDSPMTVLDNAHFKRLFSLFGVELPCRTTVSTTILEGLYNETRENVVNRLKQVVASSGKIMLVTDGWKKRTCGQASPGLSVACSSLTCVVLQGAWR